MKTGMSFLQQGSRGQNSVWEYLAGIVLVIAGYILGQLPLILVQGQMIKKYNLDTAVVNEFINTNNFELLHISNNGGFFLMLLMFVGASLGLYVALRLHGKKLGDITTSRRPFDKARFFFAFGLWLLFSLVAELVFYLLNPGNYIFHFNGEAFIILLVICLVFIPLQSCFEELFFRGYLLQGIYHFTKLPIIAVIVSTLLFSLVHTMNPEVEKFGWIPMQFYYLGAGLLFAFLALADDGLELSMGLHTATNFFGAVLLKYEGSVLQTDAVFSLIKPNVWLMTGTFYLCGIIFLYISFRKFDIQFDLSDMWKSKKNLPSN
ncbi:MAG: CPBP family intramembrane metalloprotease [Saprospiraceae bacterium]|nr:CPBP family intramembrane metalloprotease [Saprospiraceae bacterium]